MDLARAGVSLIDNKVRAQSLASANFSSEIPLGSELACLAFRIRLGIAVRLLIMVVLCSDHGGTVSDTCAAQERGEFLPEFVVVDGLFTWSINKELRHLAVEIEQCCGDFMSLGLIRVQQLRLSKTLDDHAQFPAQIERVLNGHIHTGAHSRSMSMHCITNQKDPDKRLSAISMAHEYTLPIVQARGLRDLVVHLQMSV